MPIGSGRHAPVTEKDLGRLSALVDRLAFKAEEAVSPIPEIEAFRATSSGAYAKNFSAVMHLSIAVSGLKEVQVGTEFGAMQPGAFLLMRGDTRYDARVTATENDPYLAFKVQLSPDLLAQTLLDVSDSMPDLGSPEGDGRQKRLYVGQLDEALVSALIGLIESTENSWDRRYVFPLRLRELALRLAASGAGRILRDYSAGDRSKINQAIAYIDRHIAEEMTVARVAAKVAMGVSTFARHFRRITSVSPMQYVKIARLREARLRLIQDGQTVEQAAAGVGYSSVSHFSRDFRRQHGLSPGSYVEAWLKNGYGAVSDHERHWA